MPEIMHRFKQKKEDEPIDSISQINSSRYKGLPEHLNLNATPSNKFSRHNTFEFNNNRSAFVND